jgi:hypothetical protein
MHFLCLLKFSLNLFKRSSNNIRNIELLVYVIFVCGKYYCLVGHCPNATFFFVSTKYAV